MHTYILTYIYAYVHIYIYIYTYMWSAVQRIYKSGGPKMFFRSRVWSLGYMRVVHLGRST